MAAAQASLTSAALALAASGLPVFPCNSDRELITAWPRRRCVLVADAAFVSFSGADRDGKASAP